MVLLDSGHMRDVRRWLSAVSLAVVTVVVLGAVDPVSASAQETPAAPADETVSNEPEIIATPDIGRRIEETFHHLQDMSPNLRRQRRIRALRTRMPKFVRKVERMRQEPALAELDALSPRRLLDLEQEWARVSEHVDRWQRLLENRLAALSEAKTEMREAQSTWELSRDAEREEALPPSLEERITALLRSIGRVVRRLDQRLTEVLEVSGELSDLGLRVAAIEARIASARQKAREDRERRDHEPLWLGGNALEEARTPATVGTLVEEHLDSVSTFVSREGGMMLLHGLVFLCLGLGLLLGLRGRRPSPPRLHAAPLRALAGRPLASAGLLAVVSAPLVYPYLPSVVRSLMLLALFPLLVRLSPFLLFPPRRRLLELLALAALSVPLGLGYAPAPVRRLGLLLLSLAGIVTAARLVREVRRRQDRGQRLGRIQLAAPLVSLPLGVAAYWNGVGSVEAAAVAVDGTFIVLSTAVALYCATAIATTLIAAGARHPRARVFRIFRTRRLDAVRTLQKAVRAAGMIAFLYVALVAFDVLDPLLVSVRATLRESHEFGSIEMSVGDILAFAFVIAATFGVVRLVHFLLSHEVLPRLDLGTGTEAAISLTVSYLLVALGVILAFGLAGVDPEQLALLGGALGVGIGFGLQNVVSNFVSGLILVAERPIKVGDVIEIGGDLVGEVQRIGIRSSTVRSLAGAEVIVPNAELISGQLINWTLTDARRRVDMAIGTGYQHDPGEVKRILQRVLYRQPGILSDPPPEVLCTGFGDSSIDFVLRFWTTEYVEGVRLKSRLAERVYRALDEHGIEIPYPQRDVHLRTPQAAEGEEEASP
ncbi:MAG: mechanosensitive ion channel domain-containing protein [Sandaracinaceae bacterium]